MSRASVCVVIPIYNGAERVPVLLEALALQDAPDGTFEVVVVDNASTDRVAQSIWRQPPIKKLARRSIPFRVIEEPRQGLTYARIKGVLAASAPILCFCDDDTIPASDFIRRGVEVFADPRVGLVVSAVFPHFEVPPPPSVARRLRIFAASYQLGTEPISFGAEATLAPTVGAGLWLRREAFLKAVPWRHPEQLMHDRRGNQPDQWRRYRNWFPCWKGRLRPTIPAGVTSTTLNHCLQDQGNPCLCTNRWDREKPTIA